MPQCLLYSGWVNWFYTLSSEKTEILSYKSEFQDFSRAFQDSGMFQGVSLYNYYRYQNLTKTMKVDDKHRKFWQKQATTFCLTDTSSYNQATMNEFSFYTTLYTNV